MQPAGSPMTASGQLKQERNEPMAIYLKYDGVEGNVTTKGFAKQIELTSCQFCSGREMHMAQRSDVNRGHAEPSLSEIVAAKIWDDCASVKLFEDSISG